MPSENQPTGALWQGAPLLWIHPKISPSKVFSYYLASVAQLALLGLQQCMHFGTPPDEIIVPYDSRQVEVLSATVDDWAVLRCRFLGNIDNHFPKDPILQLCKAHPLIFPVITSRVPLKGAPLIFTDGSKSGCGAYLVQGMAQWLRTCTVLIEDLSSTPRTHIRQLTTACISNIQGMALTLGTCTTK